MAKEYIEREKALMGVMRAGCMANTVQVLKNIPAADVVEVVRPNEAVLEEFENDYKDFKKIKTHLAQIIVGGKVEEPCYSILWWDKESKEYNIGYSSYCLDYVRKWLELVFEVVDTVDVVEVDSLIDVCFRQFCAVAGDSPCGCDGCPYGSFGSEDDACYEEYKRQMISDMRERRDNE